MSNAPNIERLLDLIYDDEMEETERNAFQKELEASPQLIADRDDIVQVLTGVREVWPVTTPDAAIHQNIMDAARSALVEKKEKRQSQAAVSLGFWTKLRKAVPMNQIAVVATVLFAGVFVFRFVNLNEILEEKMGEANSSISSVSFSEVSKPVPVEKTEKRIGKSTAIALVEPTIDEEKERVFTPKAEVKKRKMRSAPKPVKNSREKSRRISKKSTMRSKNKRILTDDVFEAAEPRRKEKVSSALINEVVETAQDRGKGYGSAQEAKKDTVNASNELGGMRLKYKKRDYRGVVKSADQFIRHGSGTSSERAGALYLKAQALAKLGRYSDAVSVYDTLIRKYKSYRPATMSSARAETSRRVEQQGLVQRAKAVKSKAKTSKKTKKATSTIVE